MSEVEQYLEAALSILDIPETGRGKQEFHPSYFSNAIPVLGRRFSDLSGISDANQGGTLLSDRGCWYVPQDADPEDVSRGADVTALYTDALGAHLERTRIVTPKMVRGKVDSKYLSRPIVRIDMAFIGGEEGSFTSVSGGFFSKIRGVWIKVGPNKKKLVGQQVPRFAPMLQNAIGLAFVMPSFWTVDIQRQGMPGLRMATDSLGAREAFKLRDVPEGKARRAALLHWVAAHMRKTRDPEKPAKVRKHLRGATSFTFGEGLTCRISESQDDARLRHVASGAKGTRGEGVEHANG